MASRRPLFIQKLLGHKYAIAAQCLGDDAALPWSNLGYWQQQHSNYPLAGQSLADHAAHAVQLKSSDRVLDVGCGQGASLLHWRNAYNIQQLSAVDLQAQCIANIQQHLPQVASYCGSFTQLQQLKFLNKFDVVLCIDAAYHSPLPAFLDSVGAVLNRNGRLAFHYLIWADSWQHCAQTQQLRYRYLLKTADVAWQHLMHHQQLEHTLEQHGFDDIVIKDISEAVLQGFAQYRTTQQFEKKHFDMAQLKIDLTAKLCRKLYNDGLVRYVQVSAVKR